MHAHMCTCMYVVCTCVYVNVCALPLCVDCHIVTLSTISVKQLVRKGTISLDEVLKMGMYVCIIVYIHCVCPHVCAHMRWVSAVWVCVCQNVSVCVYVCSIGVRMYAYMGVYTLLSCGCAWVAWVACARPFPFMQNVIL